MLIAGLFALSFAVAVGVVAVPSFALGLLVAREWRLYLRVQRRDHRRGG